MKSTGAAPHFSVFCIAAKVPEEFSGNEGAECAPWTQKPRLTIFWVAVVADLAARCQAFKFQVLAPEPAIYKSLFFILTALSV